MTQFFFWFLGVPTAIALALAMALAVDWAVWQLETASVRCQNRFTGWRARATQQSFRDQDRAAFFRWLRAKAGTHQMTGAVDQTLVDAQQQSELIRILVEEEVPRAVSRCVQTHRLMAQTTGVGHMSEIAYENETYGLRAQTVWLLAHTVEFLEQYPLRLDDERLLHNSIILRKRALPTCRRCPYIQMPVDQLPDRCSTAQLFQLQEAEHVTR